MGGRLTVIDGPEQGTVYEVKDTCLLGRALECQVQILDPTVSRRHARVTQANDSYLVEDLGSGNGTYVNGRSIAQIRLSTGDIIRVSHLKLLFEETQDLGSIPREGITMVGGPPDTEPRILNTLDARQPLLDQAGAVTDPADLRQMASRLRTVYAVSEAIANILDVDELLPEILNRVFDVFKEAERAFVMLYDDREQALVPKAVKRRDAKDHEGITVSRTILNEVLARRHAVLSRDAVADARFLSGHSVANFGIRSMMCAPLIWRGETLGVVYLDSQTFSAFAKPDLELLNAIAGQAALALGNVRLHTELLKRQRLEQDLHLAERIQQSFLPRRIPQLLGYTFAARYDPAYEVGGDFYDFIRLPQDRLGIVVGDVSGKGISAALYMARLTRDLRYFALAENDPGRVLQWMNRAVNEGGHDDIFVTMVYVVLETPTAEVRLASAGHMPPLVRRAAGTIEPLGKTTSVPLGILPEAEYETESNRLRPGDTMFLYTDGLIEAMNPARQMYGVERLEQSLRRATSNAATLIDRVVKDMQQHVKDAAQFDDTTVVCVGREAT